MNGTYSQGNVNLVLQQFAFTCRTFTNVMAIKHQLQYSLLSGSYYTENSGALVKVNNEEIKNFTLIMEYLQTLGGILQSIEVCEWLHMKSLYIRGSTDSISYTYYNLFFLENPYWQTLHKVQCFSV